MSTQACRLWPQAVPRRAAPKREGLIVFTDNVRRGIEGRVIYAPASGANLEPGLLKQLLHFNNSPEMGVSPP